MEQEKIFNDISNLPPEGKRQVVDFIAFLKMRYKRPQRAKQIKRTNLSNEPFIGIWKDRKDMEDSGKWVRNIRETEWSGKG